MHPETDQDFRGRILQVIQPDLRADAMIASGYGLDGLGSLCGLERKGLPDGARVNPIVEAFRVVEQERAGLAAIQPMAPGERPTEPGWYVIKDRDGDCEIAQVHPSMTRDGGFYVSFAGADMWDDLEDVLMRDKSTFIARIYPNRIEGGEG